MKLEAIEELDQGSLVHLLELFGLMEDAKEAGLVDESQYASDGVLDDLRAIVISFAMCQDHFEQISELSLLFDLSFELVSSLLESNHWRLTWDMLEDLQIMSPLAYSLLPNMIRVDIDVDNVVTLPTRVTVGKLLVFVLPDADLICSVDCPGRTASVVQILNTTQVGFGYHRIEVTVTSRTNSNTKLYFKQSVLITNTIYEYNLAIDSFLDLLVWGWEGNFTSELENALLQLLVFTHEDLHAMIQQWKTMFKSFLQGAGDDLEQLMNVIVEDLHQALSNQSTYAVGRLQQSFDQFLEMKESVMGMMVNLPTAFFDAIRVFIEAKVAASPQDILIGKLQALIRSAEEYHRSIGSALTMPSSSLANEGLKVQSFALRFANSPLLLPSSTYSTTQTTYRLTQDDILAVLKLKPKSTDAMMKMSSAGTEDGLVYVPAIATHLITNPSFFDQQIDFFTSTLYGDVINIGSMMGFQMEQYPVESTISLIMASLNHGLTYVTSETGKLMYLYPMIRSCILLKHPQTQQLCPPPLSLTKRLRDIARIFRTKKQQTLSLRLNTNFDLALAKLRQHHGQDCWIGAALEKVWRTMFNAQPVPQLLIFELWYGDELIAADFAHPSHQGLTVYVATRFFERNNPAFRLLKPGFLLALVECQYLQSQGCYLWDLGGVNMCPLMRYKYDLAGEGEERPMALATFREIVQVNRDFAGISFTPGVLIADIQLQHLYGNQAQEAVGSNSRKVKK